MHHKPYKHAPSAQVEGRSDEISGLRRRAGISCTILLAVAGALLRCVLLAVLALRRVTRLALHPATTARMHNLFRRGAQASVAMGSLASAPGATAILRVL